MDTHTYTHTYIHTYIHTHIHTHRTTTVTLAVHAPRVNNIILLVWCSLKSVTTTQVLLFSWLGILH